MPKARKLPSREEVVRLYVDECLTTPVIARMFGVSDPHTVRTQLLKAGIQLRRSGPFNSKGKCSESGCVKPVFKTLHVGNGALYGRRCKYHRSLHYAMLNRTLTRIKRAIPYSRWRWIFEIPDEAAKQARLKVEADKVNISIAEFTISQIHKLLKEREHVAKRSR